LAGLAAGFLALAAGALAFAAGFAAAALQNATGVDADDGGVRTRRSRFFTGAFFGEAFETVGFLRGALVWWSRRVGRGPPNLSERTRCRAAREGEEGAAWL
jgi:hypothetical protein